MKCSDYQKLVTDRLAGEIGREDSALLDEHLKSCGNCAAEAENLGHAWGSLSGVLRPGGAYSLEEKHHVRIREEEGRFRENRRIILYFLVSGAAACFVIFAIAIPVLFNAKTARTYPEPEASEMKVADLPEPARHGQSREVQLQPSMPPARAEAADEDEIARKAEQNLPRNAAPAPAAEEESLLSDKLAETQKAGKQHLVAAASKAPAEQKEPAAETDELPMPEKTVTSVKTILPEAKKLPPGKAAENGRTQNRDLDNDDFKDSDAAKSKISFRKTGKNDVMKDSEGKSASAAPQKSGSELSFHNAQHHLGGMDEKSKQEEIARIFTRNFEMDLAYFKLTDEKLVRNYLSSRNANLADEVEIRILSPNIVSVTGSEKAVGEAAKNLMRLGDKTMHVREIQQQAK